MDFERAKNNPGSQFSRPLDLLTENALTREQKIAILRRWEYDARELAVAEEENMGGGPPSVLPEVLEALHRLNAEIDVEHSSPTKQGGK
ncbi:hypothetical protein [Geopsychrobacter electrodiphilus]|uniref:hypothetical protein n=1 Tax=Geopsychrobacter electrodiphilus TaxID=225196 RepID=UPI00037E14EB|nr:hypothetical protein [Geopsychrobacter electrodiphilus]